MRVQEKNDDPATFLRHWAGVTRADAGFHGTEVIVQFEDPYSSVTYDLHGPPLEVRQVLVEALDALDRLGVGLWPGGNGSLQPSPGGADGA